MHLINFDDIDDRPLYNYDVLKSKSRPREASREYYHCQFCNWWGKILNPTERGVDSVDFDLPPYCEADQLEKSHMLKAEKIYCPYCGKRGNPK